MSKIMLRTLIILFFLLSNLAFAKEKICLNMIVKNESHVICRALDSVKDLIDYWVIVDTGSTDGTQEIIKEHLKNIPGELHERPWVNFGFNRTEALELAKNKGQYLLFMDADDWLEFQPGFKLPPLTEDAYGILWSHGETFSYLKPQIVKADLPWKWIGVLHEYLCCGKPSTQKTLVGVKNIYGGNGARSADPNKYLKDCKVFEDALKEEPNNERYVFYLAENYRYVEQWEKAIATYEKRVAMGGWEEEIFWSLFQIACIKQRLELPFEEVINSFNRAHKSRPHRAEPIYYLADLYNKQQQFQLAYDCVKKWEAVYKNHPKDLLFNLDWITDYGLPFQRALSSFYLGLYQEAVVLNKHVLQQKNLFEGFKKQAEINLDLSLSKLGESSSEKKTVLLTILARNKEHVLPVFLKCIDELDYDKKLISIYINTNNNSDNTKNVLEDWIIKNGIFYRSVSFENHEINNMPSNNPHDWTPERWNILGKIRNDSLSKTKEFNCDYYFIVDCDNFISPCTLKELVKKDKPIIAPLLRAIPKENDPYSNFFVDVDDNGYYKDHADYFKILNREMKGTFKVPLVHQAYLVKSEYISQLNYVDGSNDWEFIIFARSARKNGVDQYICNEEDFGTFLHTPKTASLEDERMIFSQILEHHKSLSRYKEQIHETNRKNLFIKAQLHQQKGELELALKAYDEFVLIGTVSDEIYTSLISIAQIQESLNHPSDHIIRSYERAYHYNMTQCDALYHLTRYYSQQENYQEAYKTAVEGVKLLKQRTEFNWINEFGMLLEYSLAAHRVGKFQEAIDATLKLLNHPHLSQDLRSVLKKNLTYYHPGVEILTSAEKKWGKAPWKTEVTAQKNSEKFITSNSAVKLHVCTNASDYNQNLKQLLDSSQFYGHEVNVLGLREPFSFGKRIKDYLKYLESLPEGDVVLFVDAYDILILADEKTILDNFKAMKAPCVFGVEVACHPFPHLSQYYPASSAKFKYLNAGCFIGYAGYLRQLFEALMPFPDDTDDQGLFTVYFLYHPDKIKLDYENDLFLNLYKVEPSEAKIQRQEKKVSFAQKNPCIVHGNATGKQLYQKIYDELFKDPLEGRISPQDKRFFTFKKALELMEKRRAKVVVETGTARCGSNNFEGDGGSTVIFSDWASSHNGVKFYSVDINQDYLNEADRAITSYKDAVSLVCNDSIHFLKNFKQKIDFLYLDSYDFDYNDPNPSQQHHLKEIEAAYDKLTPDSVVMIDDCQLPHGGKGKLVIEFLLQKGWKIIADYYQVILVRDQK